MIKKKILSILFAPALLSLNMANAQDTTRVTTYETTTHDHSDKTKYPLHPMEIGFHYLPMFTSLKYKTYNGEEVQAAATLGNGYGGIIAFNFSQNVGLQAEVNYNPISQKFKDRGLERTVAINYLDIPVLLSLNTNKTCPVNFNVVLGPQFGINTGSSINSSGSNSETDTMNATIAVKQGDVGAAYGAGFEFAFPPNGNFIIDLGFRGMYGLVDMSAKPVGSNTYNVLVKGARKAYGGYIGIKLAF